ncbi:transcriptional regulator, GntR family [Rhizobium sp. RU35A]|uniref:FadR/GntR family transcriptional regulator n=1 Tax=Rhizobium sp. RU35A TaxID=1907414 RepID=UPI000954839B|nr:FadR/GntR family transcriptional regulator [Rhizobium sp. RU35A]SIQ58835.1 transcriptional regulator, GntR family [Rhizobium sp. RU35A]
MIKTTLDPVHFSVALGGDGGRGGNLHEILVRRLGHMIVSGVFGAGEVLPPADELCQRFDVTRSVLREGLKVLSGKGMIEARQKTGTRVRPRADWNHLDPDLLLWRFASPKIDDVVALFELRRAIEPEAAALCARRATAEQIATLREIMQRMEEAASDNAAFALPDLQFHLAILRFTGNDLIGSLSGMIEVALLISFRLSDEITGDQRHAIPLHRALLDAISTRDEPRARAATLTLLDGAESDVRRVIARNGGIVGFRA